MEVFQKIKLWPLSFSSHSSTTTYIDFKDFFFSEKILNFLGHEIIEREYPLRWLTYRIVLNNSLIINWFIMSILCLLSFGYELHGQKDVLVMLENLTLAFIIDLVLFKFALLLRINKKKLQGIIKQVQKLYPYNAWDQYIFDVSQDLKFVKSCRIITFFIYLLLLIEYICMPFILKIYGIIISESSELQFILLTNVPLSSFAFYFMFALVFILCIFGMVIITMMDLYFMELLTVISMEFRIVGRSIAEMDLTEVEALEKLKKQIKNHQILTDVVNQLEDIWSLILFIDVFSIMFVMISTSFFSLVKKKFDPK